MDRKGQRGIRCPGVRLFIDDRSSMCPPYVIVEPLSGRCNLVQLPSAAMKCLRQWPICLAQSAIEKYHKLPAICWLQKDGLLAEPLV